MIFGHNKSVRLTAGELNRLRHDAARNGVAVNTIRSTDDLLASTLDALPSERQVDLLQFLETGRSPATDS